MVFVSENPAPRTTTGAARELTLNSAATKRRILEEYMVERRAVVCSKVRNVWGIRPAGRWVQSKKVWIMKE